MKSRTGFAGKVLSLTVCLVIGMGSAAFAMPAGGSDSGSAGARAKQSAQSQAMVDALNAGSAAQRAALAKQELQHRALVTALTDTASGQPTALAKQSAQSQATVDALNSGAVGLPPANPTVRPPAVAGPPRLSPPEAFGYRIVIAVVASLMAIALIVGARYRRRPQPTAIA